MKRLLCIALLLAAPFASAQVPIDPEALRLAIEDLTTTCSNNYPEGPGFLQELDTLTRDASADSGGEALAGLARRALLANPLLDFDRLLIVKRGEKLLGLPQNWQSNSCLPKTGYDDELTFLSLRDGTLTPFYTPGGGRFVGDVELHFDADRILFSMPADNGRWQLHEMSLSDPATPPRQLPLIHEPDVDNYDACYLPDDRIIFTSTAPFVGVPCVTGSSHVANLFSYDPEDGAIRQLTFDQDHDWCPTMLPDGRILYLRWEYSDIPHFASRILFHMNPDGSGQMEHYGSNSYWPNAMFYARPIPGHPTQFITVVGGHHDKPRMGELVLFDAARGRHEADGAIQRIPGRGKPVEAVLLDGLTEHSWPKFLHPYPLSEKYFITTAKPTPQSRWGIYLVDVFDNLLLLKELEGYALFEPLPVRPRPRPPAIPPRTDPARTDALLYLVDVCAGKGLDGVPRGAVKQLRVFTYHFAYHGVGGQVNRVGLDGPWDIKRVLGTVPVEQDGSALFRVPANTPVSLQPLDADGKALQLMRSWTTAMPGETQSCVGCHEPQSSVAATALTIAGRRAPSDITPWHGPTRGFAFKREVQPVLDVYCIGCHDGAGEKPDLRTAPPVHPTAGNAHYNRSTQFSPSYLALRRFVRAPTIESDMHLLYPGEFHADTTHLVQMLSKGHHGVVLDDESWDRLITWIDLSAPAHGTWHEIVGREKVDHQRDRRRAMMATYAGRDEDPEAIYEPDTPVAETLAAKKPPQSRPETPPSPDLPTLPPVSHPALEHRAISLPGGATLDLVLVPGGAFDMGESDTLPDEAPRTRLSIEPFWMAMCEVTNAQFALFDPAHDSRIEHGDFLQFSHEQRGCPVNTPNQPVARVSWNQAMAFCSWLAEQTGERFSLPTEAQWEYACRAGTSTPMSYGAVDADFAKTANLADRRLQEIFTFPPWSMPSGAIQPWRPVIESVDDGHRVSAGVGSYPPNPFGLHDMHGNVGEWTRSLYRPYPYDPADGRNAPDVQGKRVVRGGSWYDRPKRARSAHRFAYKPWHRVFDVGFRVMCPAEPRKTE